MSTLSAAPPRGETGPITVSVVSHGHAGMVERLIGQLLGCPEVGRIILTRNIPEPEPSIVDDRLEMIDNPRPRGFAANHNAAFRRCASPWYCVINPDIEFAADPFPALLATLDRQRAALAAPRVVDIAGRTEDSYRRFPTLRSLRAKAMRGEEGRFTHAATDRYVFPDWVAGMFMLLRSDDFAAIGGFDESFYLYYEDVDLCRRLQAAGKRIVVDLDTAVTHHARRASHRDLRHFRWHLASLARYLWRYG